MCECMETVLQKAAEQVMSKAGKYVDGSFKADWHGRVFRFDGSNNNIPLSVDYKYRPVKNNGEAAKNVKKGDISVFMSHCPFCGEKLEKD